MSAIGMIAAGSATVGLVGGVVADRLLGPPPVPTLVGEVMRAVVVAALLVVVTCSAYVIDHYRHLTPRPVLVTVWCWWVVGAALAGQVAANALTVPPTPGIYPAALGCAVAAVAAIRTARRCGHAST